MDLDKRRFDELLPFYALEAVDDEERAAIERYLAAHPEAQVELDRLLETAQYLPMLAEPLPPDPAVKKALKSRVEADLARTRPAAAAPPRRSLRDWLWPGLALGATAAAVVALIWGAGLMGRIDRLEGDVAYFQGQAVTAVSELGELEDRLALAEADAAEIEARLGEAEAQNAALRDQIRQQEDLLARYQTPGSMTVVIGDASGQNPAAIATLTIPPDGLASFAAANLPPLDASSTYQLWLIAGDTPISAGTFAVDETGMAEIDMITLPASFDAIGVSIEPAGGSVTPTVDQIILLGATGG